MHALTLSEGDREQMTDSTSAVPGGTASSATSEQKSPGRKLMLFLRDLLLIVLAAILISFLVKTFLIRSFFIPSQSMESTLLVDDRIIVNELVPDLVDLQRGDVVVFRDPGGWVGSLEPDTRDAVQKAADAALGFVGLATPDSDEHLIKRVIGLPGDTVACCDELGAMSVNGTSLDEPYIQTGGQSDAAPGDFEVTVPPGMVWVMGDNRYNSRDSLAHYLEGDSNGGFVPIEKIVGRAFVVSWPADRWTWLDNYPETFADIDEMSSTAG